MSRWPAAGPSEYWLLASSEASKVKNSNTHVVQHIHIRWQHTQDNYIDTHVPANNNYTQGNLKLVTMHTRQIRIQHVQKVETHVLTHAMEAVYFFTDVSFGFLNCGFWTVMLMERLGNFLWVMNWKENGRNWRHSGVWYCSEDLLETRHAYVAMELLLCQLQL